MASIAVGFSPIMKTPISIASTSQYKHHLIPSFPNKTHLGISPNTFFTTPLSISPFSPILKTTPLWAASDSAQPETIPPADAEAEAEAETESDADPAEESQEPASESAQKPDTPKGANVFAVVMVGSRQYIVIPGRYIYTQRLKGANVNDKIILNKVLLVGTKTDTYVGKPVVPNAVVHAVVEEQGLDKKVIVFKYKKRKNYRRNIGHRQPNTRLRITGICGYEDAPGAASPAATPIAA